MKYRYYYYDYNYYNYYLATGDTQMRCGWGVLPGQTYAKHKS